MPPCPVNWLAFGDAVVYYSLAALSFRAGIKYRHCIGMQATSQRLGLSRWFSLAIWVSYSLNTAPVTVLNKFDVKRNSKCQIYSEIGMLGNTLTINEIQFHDFIIENEQNFEFR